MRLFGVALVATLLCVAQSAVAGVDELAVGGRFMWDATAWSGVEKETDGAWNDVSFVNGTETRNARVFLKGKVYENLNFKVVYDFADGDEIALKDAYLDLVGVPGVGNVRVGQFLEPLCMNAITSSKCISFVEGASLTAFAPSRNAGLMVHDKVAGGRLNYEVGLFLDTGDMAEKEGDDDYSVAARLACLVAGEEMSRRVLHVGAALNYFVPGGGVQYSQRPEVHLSDRLVDTGTIMNAETVLRYGGELAGVFGSLHVSGEYMVAGVTKSDESAPVEARGDTWLADDGSFAGYYAEAGYFLTGEHRTYKDGFWDRTKPDSNFLKDGGLGAWEVLARYSSLDLNDDGAEIYGGKMDNVTLGLNWYLHSNARLMFNYVMSSVTDHDDEDVGKANAFTMRTQFDF
ncbi:MAG: porin [Candidatus Eisenbacteria bacterium]